MKVPLNKISILTILLTLSCSDNPKVIKPSSYFVEFAEKLAEIGYTSEISRAERVANLRLEKGIVLNGNPFFRINPSDHLLTKLSELSAEQHAVFKKAQLIFSYYYVENKKSTMLTDGIIEEWQFEMDEEAERALIEFEKIKDLTYFNTESYSFRTGDYLYIFHTRAAAFVPELEKIYNLFKEERMN